MLSRTRICCMLLVSILLSVILTIPCNAIDSAVITEDIDEEQTGILFSSFKIERIEEQAIRSGFSCFDVNEQEDYALGFNSVNIDYIQVYDTYGNYMYGFKFNCQGSFCIELKIGSFVIYDIRSGLAVHVSQNGECIDVKNVLDTSENISYRQKTFQARKKVRSNAVYMAEHSLSNSESILWNTYPRLVRTAVDGTVTVLFEKTDYQGIIFSIIYVFPLAILLVGGIVIICIVKKRKRADAVRGQGEGPIVS